MKKAKLYLFVALILLLGIAVLALVIRLIYCYTEIAAAIMSILIGTAIVVWLIRQLIIRFAPRSVAEKRLENFIRAGTEAHIAYYEPSDGADDQEAGPSLCFSTSIQYHDGLKILKFSDIKPQNTLSEVITNCGSEMNVYFFDDSKRIRLIGTLEMLHNSKQYGFQITVHTVEISGRTQGFSV